MKIIDTYSYSIVGAYKEYTIVQAVEKECTPYVSTDPNDEQDGASLAQEAVDKTREFLGKLTQLLYEKNILLDDDILSLLGSNYRIEK